MTKVLNGRDLADFIKERQAKQVRGLIQHDTIQPKLAIIQTIDIPVIDTYVRLKSKYGEDIQVQVDIHKISHSQVQQVIKELNHDESVHGIIVQLPLEDTSQTDEIVNSVEPSKDVDGLGKNAILDPATPMAINWLLAGYNVDLKNKNILIVGNGRLVGAPLARMWRNSHLEVKVVDSSCKDLSSELCAADIIVSATGVPGLIKSEDIKLGAVVVDAGTASEHGKIVGDVAPDVRERSDLTITPEKGGVGPLTIVALMDNVIRSARQLADSKPA